MEKGQGVLKWALKQSKNCSDCVSGGTVFDGTSLSVW